MARKDKKMVLKEDLAAVLAKKETKVLKEDLVNRKVIPAKADLVAKKDKKVVKADIITKQGKDANTGTKAVKEAAKRDKEIRQEIIVIEGDLAARVAKQDKDFVETILAAEKDLAALQKIPGRKIIEAEKQKLVATAGKKALKKDIAVKNDVINFKDKTQCQRKVLMMELMDNVSDMLFVATQRTWISPKQVQAIKDVCVMRGSVARATKTSLTLVLQLGQASKLERMLTPLAGWVLL